MTHSSTVAVGLGLAAGSGSDFTRLTAPAAVVGSSCAATGGAGSAGACSAVTPMRGCAGATPGTGDGVATKFTCTLSVPRSDVEVGDPGPVG